MCLAYRDIAIPDGSESFDIPLNYSSCGMKRDRERHSESSNTSDTKKMSVDNDAGDKGAQAKPVPDIEPWKTMGCGIHKGMYLLLFISISFHCYLIYPFHSLFAVLVHSICCQ